MFAFACGESRLCGVAYPCAYLSTSSSTYQGSRSLVVSVPLRLGWLRCRWRLGDLVSAKEVFVEKLSCFAEIISLFCTFKYYLQFNVSGMWWIPIFVILPADGV